MKTISIPFNKEMVKACQPVLFDYKNNVIDYETYIKESWEATDALQFGGEYTYFNQSYYNSLAVNFDNPLFKKYILDEEIIEDAIY